MLIRELEAGKSSEPDGYSFWPHIGSWRYSIPKNALELSGIENQRHPT